MGFIRMFFLFSKMFREEKKKQRIYRAMSLEELEALSNEELYEALNAKIEQKVGRDEIKDILSYLNISEKIFFVLNLFDMEVQNGGLCQFYTNSSRDAAPFVSECLYAIGAISQQKLFDEFNSSNQIDLCDLTSFILLDINDFEKQNERYPFDTFDDAYYELYEKEPLDDLLVKYARNHMDDFY